MSEEKKVFTLAELANYNSKRSLYVSIKGKVYDVTKFIDEVIFDFIFINCFFLYMNFHTFIY